jgi:hypothetical protein
MNKDILSFFRMWQNFKEMPLLLKFLTFYSVFCIFFFISSAVPFFNYFVNGVKVTYSEWWSSGMGLVTTIMGLVMPYTGYLFLHRHKYAREVYLSVFFGLALLRGTQFGFQLEFMIGVVAFILLMGLYLYGRDSVQIYLYPSAQK